MGSYPILVFKLVFISTMDNSDMPSRSKRLLTSQIAVPLSSKDQHSVGPLSNDANSKTFTNSEPESE